MMPLRLRQLLAVTILVVVVFLLLGLVVGPLLAQFRSGQEQIDDLEQRLAVYQRLIAELPAQEQRLAALKRDNPVNRLLLAESRPALAGAELQQQVTRLIGEMGAQLVSVQIVTTTDGEAPVASVGVKVHLRGETEQLVRLLYTLGWHEPLLLVENLVVLSNPRVDMQRFRRAEDIKAVPSLDVTFDLKGFIAKAETP